MSKYKKYLKCESCGSINLIEFDPRSQECTEGQECEYIAHEINDEICISCDDCGTYNWISNEEFGANYEEEQF